MKSDNRSTFLHRLFFLLLACASSVTWGQANWREGDLIFRTGTEAVSDVVMFADDSGYSHVGILIGSPEHWQVLHATPEEVPGQGNKVVLDSLAFFTAPQRSLRHHVFRIEASDEERTLATQRAMEQLGQPFSMLDPEGIYCTTLIWKAWRDIGIDLQVRFTPVHFPLVEAEAFLLPSGLIESPRISMLPR